MTDPIATLSAANPVGDRAPSPAEAERMDAALHRLLAAEPPARTRRRSRRWIAVPVALGAAVVALGLALPERTPGPIPAPPPANAAMLLTQLSHKVAGEPVRQGKYAYLKQIAYESHMRSRKGGKGTYVVVLPHTYEQWVAEDGTAIAKSFVDEAHPSFPTPEDKRDYEAANAPKFPWDETPYSLKNVKLGGMLYSEVQALPTDPAQLKARLEQDKEMSITAKTGQLLAAAQTPPQVKVALFTVLKQVPGVGVQFDDPAWRTLFVFDPDSGALLATRSIGHKEVPGRDIDDWSLVVDSGWRDSAPPLAR
jgi:hypothetical protein